MGMKLIFWAADECRRIDFATSGFLLDTFEDRRHFATLSDMILHVPSSQSVIHQEDSSTKVSSSSPETVRCGGGLPRFPKEAWGSKS